MKKLICFFVLLPLLSCLVLPQTASAKRIRTFQELLAENKTIKIYVEDILNSTGDNKIRVDDLKAQLEIALKTRMSDDLALVDDPKNAVVVLKSDIIEYYWTEEDPIDQIHSAAALAMDIMKKEHYVRMTVDFKLSYVPTGKIIWEKPLKATITDNNMSEEDSYEMVNERMVPVFLRNLFKKDRRSRSEIHIM